MAGLLDWLSLEPFDPSKHKAQDVGLGGNSTEFLSTEYDQNGSPFNFPRIWFDKDGNPQVLSPEEAYQQAMIYERMTGKSFPRFDSIESAVDKAIGRSALGGADGVMNGLLAR